MLTKDEFLQTLDAHIAGATQLARGGHVKEAMAMLPAMMTLSWEITRPTAEFHRKDIDGLIPDKYRSVIAELAIFVVIGEDGKALMAWGAGKNHDGNDAIKQGELPDEATEDIFNVIDEAIREHFSHLDLSLVSSFDEFMDKRKVKLTKFTTTHVEVTKEAIDKAAEEFNDEFDRLFETWGGGNE